MSPDRLTSLSLVALLHLLLLWALLQMAVQPKSHASPREFFLRIAAPERERTSPLPPPPLPPLARPSRGGVFSGVQPSLAPVAPPPDVRGLGQSLFDCAPENLPNLSPQQRSSCHGLTRPDDTLLVEPPSHVKDPQRRAAGPHSLRHRHGHACTRWWRCSARCRSPLYH
jgi:hypothetical protein